MLSFQISMYPSECPSNFVGLRISENRAKLAGKVKMFHEQYPMGYVQKLRKNKVLSSKKYTFIIVNHAK